jgi:predicted DNA-binding protein (UPF0251 family)
MPRPLKRRCCRRYQADRIYKPQGVPMRDLETTVLSLDQFEAVRLCDIEGLDQTEAGERMGISRGTVQRLLYNARKQIGEAILGNKALVINLKESEACDVGMYTYPGKRRKRRHRL